MVISSMPLDLLSRIQLILIHHFGWVLLATVAWSFLWALIKTRRTLTIHPRKTYVLLVLHAVSHCLWLGIVWIVIKLWQGEMAFLDALLRMTGLAILTYARFIEPHRLIIRHHDYQLAAAEPLKQPVRLVLLGDIHIGLFSGQKWQLRRIAQHIRQLAPDAVLVAGDWTYEPRPDQLDHLNLWSQLGCPVYSVTGNHDEQVPGPPIRHILQAKLEQYGIQDIEHQCLELAGVRLIGVGDLWAKRAVMPAADQWMDGKPTLILAHNPDTVDYVPMLNYKPLMLSGHTHGGQVFLPFITRKVLKQFSVHGHRVGWYQHPQADVLVTAGTGTVGMPLRFLVPPTIDVIHLR